MKLWRSLTVGAVTLLLAGSMVILPACTPRRPIKELETNKLGETVPATAVAIWDVSAAHDESVHAYLRAAETPDRYTLDVFGNGAMADHSTDVLAPWGEYTDKILSVNVHDGVTHVGAYAFTHCNVLSEVTLASGVETIGNNAFADCWSLARVNLPDTLSEIGDYAFYKNANLPEVSFPVGLKSIGAYAFSECTTLASAMLPDGLENVGTCAFQKCRQLTAISVPDRAMHIGLHVFAGTAYYMNEENWDAGTIYVGNHLLRVTSTEDGAVVIREGTVHICDSAFVDCNSELASVTIPAQVTCISADAFNLCRQLKDIYFLGTIEEWRKIDKEENWNLRSRKYVIHCNDGDLAKEDDV